MQFDGETMVENGKMVENGGKMVEVTLKMLPRLGPGRLMDGFTAGSSWPSTLDTISPSYTTINHQKTQKNGGMTQQSLKIVICLPPVFDVFWLFQVVIP